MINRDASRRDQVIALSQALELCVSLLRDAVADSEPDAELAAMISSFDALVVRTMLSDDEGDAMSETVFVEVNRDIAERVALRLVGQSMEPDAAVRKEIEDILSKHSDSPPAAVALMILDLQPVQLGTLLLERMVLLLRSRQHWIH